MMFFMPFYHYESLHDSFTAIIYKDDLWELYTPRLHKVNTDWRPVSHLQVPLYLCTYAPQKECLKGKEIYARSYCKYYKPILYT